MTITATPGSTTADSYVTLADADSYHANRLHNATWIAASDSDKEAALKWATRLLDRENWVGTRSTESQALRWPRLYVDDRDGYPIDSATIPQFLKNATSELAFLLIATDRTADSGTEGFKKIKVDSIELEIDSVDRIGSVSKEVNSMIEGYMQQGFRLQRG